MNKTLFSTQGKNGQNGQIGQFGQNGHYTWVQLISGPCLRSRRWSLKKMTPSQLPPFLSAVVCDQAVEADLEIFRTVMVGGSPTKMEV